VNVCEAKEITQQISLHDTREQRHFTRLFNQEQLSNQSKSVEERGW
jgi:hypothetical protein